MKFIMIGAAGLLLSTSALAATPQIKGMARPASPAVASKNAESLGAAMIGNAITIDWAAKAADASKVADPRKVIEASAKTKPETAAAEAPSTVAMTGMGGPEEPVAALPPPVRAFSANNYPPCHSRADDHCIQLNDPGVRQSLAAFQASHGLNQNGMGGPEEAVAELATYAPLPEDAVMPATEDMPALPAKGPDVPAAI